MKKLLLIALASISIAAFVGCAPTSDEPTNSEANIETTTGTEEAETSGTEADSTEGESDTEEAANQEDNSSSN